MFSQWLLVFSSLLFLSGPVMTTGLATRAVEKDEREVTKFVSADVQYGWQLSGGAVSVYEVPVK
jgi:hypothetical protein